MPIPHALPALAAALSFIPAILAPSAAMARPVLSGGAFGAGYLGPVIALIPLLGFLAVGMWAVQQGGRSVWRMPVAALVAALCAGLAAFLSIPLPFLGQGQPIALIVLGIAVALGVRAPDLLAMLVVAIAAVFLGYGYGTGAARGADPLPYWAGIGLGAALVLCSGVGVATVTAQAFSQTASRMIGLAVAVVGGLILVDFL